MKLIYIVFVICCIPFTIYSQIVLSGKIVSIKNSEPISFATLQLLDVPDGSLLKYTTTDAQGNYNFEIEAKGNYSLKITHISYITIIENIVVNKVENTKDYSLKPNINFLKEVVLDFKPKVMKIFNDTITYNLNQLTNGNEKTLADIIEKLPGVKINNSGRITVNGKMVKKLLIDGEELFKNQHKTTTESIGAKMIDGVRYLDKYNDFGNITGFNNKQTNALDVSIKDEYKNKITGDIKLQGGYQSKYLADINLFRFGGDIKLGFLGNWNTLGKQSITSYEYNQLKGISYEETDQNGFIIDRPVDASPKFLDPTIDVADRDNLFGALSLIYKPSLLTKISLLHIFSKTTQNQLFTNNRQFFEIPEQNLFEDKKVNASFLVNSTIFDFGYQPNEKSFIEYSFNFNPQNSKENYQINLTNASETLTVNQLLENTQFTLDQKLSLLNRVTNKTLLKITGLFVKENKDEDLNFLSNNRILPPLDSNSVKQIISIERNIYGYQLQSVTKIKKNKLRFGQGVVFSESSFISNSNKNDQFTNNFQTERVDSYFNATFDGKLSKRIKLVGKMGYRFVSLKRFEKSFENIFFQPTVSFLYKPKNSKLLNFEYEYTVDLPNDSSVITNLLVENYYTLKNTSQIQSNQILPEHRFSSYYSYNNSSSGSSFSTFINYNFAPEFIATNNTVDQKGNTIFSNFIAKKRHSFNYNLRFDKRLKNKIGIYNNFNFNFSESQNRIDNEPTLSKTNILKNKVGFYSRFRKGVNFNIGLDVEFTNYKIMPQNIKTLASIIKPFITINGAIKKDVLSWNLGSYYAIYETDLTKQELFNIYPSLLYKINDKVELTIIGNNILNIENATISQNINAVNYFESSIVNTLEGYVILGVTYKL